MKALGLERGGKRALFVDAKDEALPYHALRWRVRRYAALAGLTVQVTPHTFRRSCTTELLRAGANMYHVKEMLGTSPSTPCATMPA